MCDGPAMVLQNCLHHCFQKWNKNTQAPPTRVYSVLKSRCVELKKQKSQTLTHELDCNWGLTGINRRVSQSPE